MSFDNETTDEDVCPECELGYDECECEHEENIGEGRLAFDKFMDRIVISENKRGMNVMPDSPQRARQQRRQERPLGRIRYGAK